MQFTLSRFIRSTLRFFSTDKKFLQMYIESISTLHSIDNNSALTLKVNLYDHQKYFYPYFLPCTKYTQTHRKIFHGVDVNGRYLFGEIKIRANQNSLFPCCNRSGVITNKIIFHTFQEKSRGIEHDYQR